MILFLLFACAPSTDSLDSAAGADLEDTGGAADSGPTPADLVEPSAGSCPDFSKQKLVFVSGGLDREALVYLPDGEMADAPVLFVWHPLGGDARYMARVLDLEDYATENGAIVVIPEASGKFAFEWDFAGDGKEDLVLFDDLRSCVVSELGADVRRISTTGFSAGALWATYLGIHRGDTLASLLTFSGGTGSMVRYAPPAMGFPALLTEGGEGDVYGTGGASVSFHDATWQFAEELHADEHFVTVCSHTRGHDLPPDADIILREWPLAHRYGQPSPFAEAGIGALPDICAVYTGE
jgi:poly(3-hydroxybutyrate) depolymerase